MSSNNSNSNSGGIGVLGVLGIIFVVLKLVGVINWSWWYVTMPFWGVFALIIIVFIVVLAWKATLELFKNSG